MIVSAPVVGCWKHPRYRAKRKPVRTRDYPDGCAGCWALWEREHPKHLVQSDGVTVWVNGPTSLMGRFGKNGIDIHREPRAQLAEGECLFCTHAVTTAEDWETFKVKMLELYSVVVGDEHKPDRFKAPKDPVIAAAIEEKPYRCCNCTRVAHHSAFTLDGGRWTCYGCGRVNSAAETEVT